MMSLILHSKDVLGREEFEDAAGEQRRPEGAAPSL